MDKDLFQQFYQEHKKSVFAIVNLRISDLEDAKDVVQEIFLELWLKRDQLADIKEIKTYIYVVARNHVISAFRKKDIQLRNEGLLLQGLNTLDHSAEDNTMAKELVQQINSIVQNLPDTTRQCYHLSKNEGKRNGEIADLLDISEKTVRNNISEALKRLKSNLKASHPELLALLVFLFR